MDADDNDGLTQAQGRKYAALRSDLSAALAAFDRAQDWADLIHDLQRVNRVLSKYPTLNSVPEKHLLAKRLSQCLTSFLPSGVHLKALETYHIVFTRIGKDRLALDLPLYAGGLFPLLSHCSTSLKDPLFSLYETHFLPLGNALTPILDGFTVAILPGLEDETSESFTRARSLLDNIAKSVSDICVFSRSLWNALLLSPPMRAPAAKYLRSTLASEDFDLRPSMITDMPLVAYAITSALTDDDALTQRSVLDLLLDEFALHSAFFQSTHPDHRDAAVAVVGGVFGTLLRRDMSLTKRVHAWLLGGNDSHVGMAFCKKYSEDLVLAALDAEIDQSLKAVVATDSVKVATRPCRIATALMDRDELSTCLGHSVAIRILKHGRKSIERDQAHDREIRSAISSLLHDLGSARLFSELERMLTHEEQRTDVDFELLSFALSLFPTKDDVVRRKHLPALLQVAVQSLNAVSSDTVTLDRAVGFCSKAVSAMDLSRDRDIEETLSSSIKEIVGSFASFFVAWLAHVIEACPVEVRRSYADVTVTEEYAAEIRMASMTESRKEAVSLAKGACQFFVSVVSAGVGCTESTSCSLQATAKCANSADVRISLAGARAFADVAAYTNKDSMATGEREEQVMGVIRRCWRQMHPSLRTATPQCAQTFLSLQHRFPEEVKTVVADGILSNVLSRRMRNLERFACLWRLAVEHRLRPLPDDNGLFLMLDALTDEHWSPKMLARSWLSDSLEIDPTSVLDAPLRLLLTPESRTVESNHEFLSVYDAPRALYGFQVLCGILESCPTVVGSSNEHGLISLPRPQVSRKDHSVGRTGIRALASAAPSARTSQALAKVFATDSDADDLKPPDSAAATEGPVVLSKLLPAQNYIVTVALTCLGYLRGKVPEQFISDSNGGAANDADDVDSIATSLDSTDDAADLEWTLAGLGGKSLHDLHAGVCAAAAECLAALLTTVPVPSQMSSVVANLFAGPVLNLVSILDTATYPVLELHFLNVLSFLVTADGPCYMSSVLGKQLFSKSSGGLTRPTQSDSNSPLLVLKNNDRKQKDVQIGSAEALEQFVPWVLDGISSIYRLTSSDHDSGSQEVMGVRRRWIQLADTVLRHVGVTLPTIADGLLLLFCELLECQNAKDVDVVVSGDSEFSRVDETLILLDGLAVVTSNVLWSFEYALSRNDLNDAQGHTVEDQKEAINRAIPQHHVMGPGHRADSMGSLKQEGATLKETSDALPTPASLPTIGERSNSVSNATNAMINALNPLRMINDFVKDVFTGNGTDGAHRHLDPRRSAARLLITLLPRIVIQSTHVWGPTSDVHRVEKENSKERLSDSFEPPRLSMELPRERRQSQRTAILAILEPIFELRPVDVVAAAISLFCIEQDNLGSLPQSSKANSPTKTICHILHAMDFATPEVIIGAVKFVLSKAMAWDNTSLTAEEGRSQAILRSQAESVISTVVSSGFSSLDPGQSAVLGRVSAVEKSSSLPGGVPSSEIAQPLFSSGNGPVPLGHNGLFHPGDFFAAFPAADVEVACINFLEQFLATCSDGDDTLHSWSSLQSLIRDALAHTHRKSMTPAVLRLLGTFVSKNPSPFPERRYRREIMSTSAAAIAACSSLAAAQVDISNDEQQNVPDYKRMLSVVALKALAKNLCLLVDATFLDDKQQTTNSVIACLSPSISSLKRAATRAAALQTARSLKRNPSVETELSEKQKLERQIEADACKAAGDILLSITYRDWGFKLARRELMTHMDDPNFFYGKGDGVLQRLSGVVKEIVASGGASALLTSIGSVTSNGAPGIPSLFVGRDAETILRGRSVRRMAYCVFVSEPEHFTAQLPFVLEKVRDALRMTDSALVGECLFCLRALLLRTGAASISAFRATALSELFRIVSNPTHDLNATASALKFLDLLTLLSPPDFGYERCFFFGKSAKGPTEDEEKVFRPLVPYITSLWSTEEREKDEIFAPPLRLEIGRTVLAGSPPAGFGTDFIGRYASALVARNSMPKMQARNGDLNVLCNEFELEFLEA